MLQSFKIVVSSATPTAGVGFDKGGKAIVLHVNPDFFGSLTDAERVAIMIHEVSHVDRLHLIRCREFADFERANVAADLAINCYIQGLPEGALYPKAYRMPEFKTMEYYYEAAASKAQGPSASHDDHSAWGDSTLSVDAQAAIVEQTMQRALEKLGAGAGDLPAHVVETLRALKSMRVKAWHRELKRFVAKHTAWDTERTWSRRNRRYGLLEAGTKLGKGRKIAVAFDTSGSMSASELGYALTEVNAMLKCGAQGLLVLFDTQVNSVAPLKRASQIDIADRGGTNFVDLFAKVDALHCDGLVVFTDGDDCGERASKPKTPVLWVYTQGMRDKYPWGSKTTLGDK
jgi:predicted metal-dependent peptidase